MNAPARLLDGVTVGVDGAARPLRVAGRWLADLGAGVVSVTEAAASGADDEWLGPMPPRHAGGPVDVLLTRAAAPAAGVPARATVTVMGSGETAADPSRELTEAEAAAAGGIAVAIGDPGRDPLSLPSGSLDSLVGAHAAAAAVAALADGCRQTSVAAADVAAWLVATNIKMY